MYHGFYTVNEIGELLGTSADVAERAIKTTALRVRRAGRRYGIATEDLKEILTVRRGQPRATLASLFTADNECRAPRAPLADNPAAFNPAVVPSELPGLVYKTEIRLSPNHSRTGPGPASTDSKIETGKSKFEGMSEARKRLLVLLMLGAAVGSPSLTDFSAPDVKFQTR